MVKMAYHIVGRGSLIPGLANILCKFYAITGTLLVIVPMMALVSFAIFIYGLTSEALLDNGNIEIESKFIELNVRDTTKDTEILGYAVKQHLLATEKESRSELMSIRRTEEHAKEKRENLKKRKKRLNEIQNKLQTIKKMRNKNTIDLKQNGKKMARNKSVIKKAERYLDNSIWLSIFSVFVMLLGGLTAKIGFKRWNEVSVNNSH
jgi:hypothetical protein